jgi:hypothetical protein
MKRIVVLAVLVFAFTATAQEPANVRRLPRPTNASPVALLDQTIVVEPLPGGGERRSVSMRLAISDGQGRKTTHDLGTARSAPPATQSARPRHAQEVTGKEPPIFSGRVEQREIERRDLPERVLRGVRVTGRRWVNEIPALPGVFPEPHTETTEVWADASGRVLQMATSSSTGRSSTTDYFEMPAEGIAPEWFTARER